MPGHVVRLPLGSPQSPVRPGKEILMPRMILKPVHRDGERRRLPLSERIVDENLGRFRHVPQPRERRRSDRAGERLGTAARHA